MFTYSFVYWILVLYAVYGKEPVWKLVLVYLILSACILGFWGFMVYEDENTLWGGRIFTRTVTCIGHTEFSTRYSSTFWLDIMGEDGEILDKIEIPHIIYDSVKQHDRLLAVTNSPECLTPIRLVPLSEAVTPV